jgi:FKBP-type peptidyl-prolyl cis-trans isomerase FklB
MKFSLVAVLAVLLLVSQAMGQEKLVLKDQKDKVSYSIGTDIAGSLKKQSIDINGDALVQGIRDVLSNSKTLLAEEEIRAILTSFQKEMLAQQVERNKEAVVKNKKEGAAFLAENKKKEGVVTRPSGLQYKVISAGTGKSPKATDTVVANYRGKLLDGTEFDSSFTRGEPANFQVTGVIPGWTEALQMMKTGAKWQVFIPAELAYGERGVGNIIPPNSTLIFDIELISIK